MRWSPHRTLIALLLVVIALGAMYIAKIFSGLLPFESTPSNISLQGNEVKPDVIKAGNHDSTLPSATCAGVTYYVSNAGSDSNAGTSASSPWKTVANVVSSEPNLRAGDCVLFQRGGVWYEQLKVSSVHGTQTAPITFGNYGSGNRPVLDGGSTRQYGIVGGNASGQAANSYVTIDGFEVRNATQGGIIFSYLAQAGITIQNNYVHHNGYGAYAGACAGCFGVDSGQYGYNEGIAFVGYPVAAYGAKILNNIVKVEGGHNAIMVDQDTGSPLIQGNVVGPGCSHNCIDFKRSVGVTVRQNTTNCSGTLTVNGQSYPSCNGNAFYTEQGTVGQSGATFMETGTLERNIAYGAASNYACFHAQGQASPSGGTTLNYYNNTCYIDSTTPNAAAFYPGDCMGGTLKIYNNIFQGSPGSINTGTNCTVLWDYNTKYQSSGGPTGAHDVNVNPLILNPSLLDFHLQSGSPVINSGNSSVLGLTYIGACGTSGTCP